MRESRVWRQRSSGAHFVGVAYARFVLVDELVVVVDEEAKMELSESNVDCGMLPTLCLLTF